MPVIDAASYGSDKSPDYMRAYAQAFEHLYDLPIVLLELGVQTGASLLMWRDVFPKAQIIGLDLNEIPVSDGTGRVHVYQGFQQDPEVLDRIHDEMAPGGFDIVIDDASHVGQYTAASFWHLFPLVKPGGIYVLEDWPCGYDPDWPDGHAPTKPELAEATGKTEALRQRVRSAARPIASRLPGPVRARLERVYMRAEGATLQTRFPSHDYGMVGFAKQLVDECGTIGPVASINFRPGQAFVYKRG